MRISLEALKVMIEDNTKYTASIEELTYDINRRLVHKTVVCHHDGEAFNALVPADVKAVHNGTFTFEDAKRILNELCDKDCMTCHYSLAELDHVQCDACKHSRQGNNDNWSPIEQ